MSWSLSASDVSTENLHLKLDESKKSFLQHSDEDFDNDVKEQQETAADTAEKILDLLEKQGEEPGGKHVVSVSMSGHARRTMQDFVSISIHVNSVERVDPVNSIAVEEEDGN